MTTDRDDPRLEALFRAARGAELAQDDLVARVLADAARVQAETAAPRPVVSPQGRRGRVAGLIASFGGWPAVSGVTLAGLAGLAVGFAAPDLVDTWSGGQIWTLSDGVGAVPEMGALWDGTWEEGGDV